MTHNGLAKMNLSLAGPDYLIVISVVLPNHTLKAVLWLLMKCSSGLTGFTEVVLSGFSQVNAQHIWYG